MKNVIIKIQQFLQNHPALIFVFSLLCLSYYYNYHHILFFRPQSIHYWRQSECASIALNFYQHGIDIFKPELHNSLSDNFTTGYGTSECPLLYAFVALLYKIFGVHEFIFRLLNVLIFFCGLFALFKLVKRLINDNFWGIAIALLFFASPVLVYYANNFLTDITALSLTFIGWYLFYSFYESGKNKYFYLSAAVFMLAGLLKITSAMSFIIFAGIFILERIPSVKFKKDIKIFDEPLKQIFPFIIFFVLIISWYSYAIYFNTIHQSYLINSTKMWPIWELDKDNPVSKIWLNVREIWLFDYFNKFVLSLFGLMLIAIVVFIRKTNFFFRFVLFSLFAGIVLYVLLWIYVFKDHDYYVINLYMLPVLICLTFTEFTHRYKPKIISSWITKLLFAFLLLHSAHQTHRQLTYRYSTAGWMNNDWQIYQAEGKISPYLRELGIKAEDKIISIPDFTPNYSLYLMNQRGYTTVFDENKDSITIKKSIERGAKYLIVADFDIIKYPYLGSYIKNQIGQFINISIFNVGPVPMKNYVKPVQYDSTQIACDAESYSNDGYYFLSKDGNYKFENANCSSDKKSHSGKYSCKLNVKHQYGMTYIFTDSKPYDRFVLTVWKTKGNPDAILVVTSTAGKQFYRPFKTVSKTEGDWEQIQAEFVVPDNIDDGKVGIYLFNPSKTDTYFDDLEIVKYKVR